MDDAADDAEDSYWEARGERLLALDKYLSIDEYNPLYYDMKHKQTSTTNKWLPIEGRFNLAGVQYSDYQLVCGSLKAGTVCRLVAEPRNQYDSAAISIRFRNISLGYLPAKSIHQSECHRYYKLGHKLIAVITAFNKSNPTWCMITVQLKRYHKPMRLVNVPKEIEL